VVGVNQVAASIVAGCAVSCGAVLVVAGASKLYRGARGVDGATAMRRALRMPRDQWRRAELAVGAAELAMGVLVCSGVSRVLGGVVLASFGAVFCVLLGYVRVKRVPGDCGCIRWRSAQETAPEPATWRAMVRSGMLFCVGTAYVMVPAGTAGAPDRAWFGGGMLAGGTVMVLLSMHLPVRTRVCQWPPWRRIRTRLRVLAGHEMFAEMAASAGPFGPVARYRRTGCTDEFWFTAATGPARQAVVFRVSHAAPDGRLAVHASVRDGRAPGTTWPSRVVSAQDLPG
jgi:Methylamine utilisation protein MauE